jgi:hypothetical protein
MSVAILVPAASDARTGVWSPTARRPSAWTRGGPCGSRCGHGNSRDGHLSGTAATAGDGRFKEGEHGRCPAAMATRAARAGIGAVLSQTLSDTSAVAVRHAVLGPEHLRTACRVRRLPGGCAG